MDGHTDRQRDKHRRWTDGQTSRETERWKDKSHKDMTYGQTNRHAGRKKYRQADRHKGRLTVG